MYIRTDIKKATHRLVLLVWLLMIMGLVMGAPVTVLSTEISTEDILKELNSLKNRVNRLEKELIIKDKEIEKRLSRLIPKGKAKQFNWGIIDFSAIICSRKPKCKKCFLNDLCYYFKAIQTRMHTHSMKIIPK